MAPEDLGYLEEDFSELKALGPFFEAEDTPWLVLVRLDVVGKVVNNSCKSIQGGPRTRYNLGEITPTIRVKSPQLPNYKAIYRGPRTPFITGRGPSCLTLNHQTIVRIHVTHQASIPLYWSLLLFDFLTILTCEIWFLSEKRIATFKNGWDRLLLERG